MFYFVRCMMDDWMGRVILLSVSLLFMTILLLIYLGIQEQKTWDAFVVANNCKVVARMSGSMATGFANGIGRNSGMAITITSMPGQTGWQCDDGVTYYR